MSDLDIDVDIELAVLTLFNCVLFPFVHIYSNESPLSILIIIKFEIIIEINNNEEGST